MNIFQAIVKFFSVIPWLISQRRNSRKKAADIEFINIIIVYFIENIPLNKTVNCKCKLNTDIIKKHYQ